MKKLTVALLSLVALTASAAVPKGWIVAGSAPADYEIGVDATAKDGKVAFIKAKPQANAAGFGTLMQMFPADEYRGGRWRLSARMRTEDAAKAQLWMRVDGPDNKPSAFDNMNDRPVTGNSEWKRYEVVLDVADDSAAVAFGFFLAGGGKVWADDFKLERVPLSTPLTGSKTAAARGPANLGFEE
jgi:hypothetical protein